MTEPLPPSKFLELPEEIHSMFFDFQPGEEEREAIFALMGCSKKLYKIYGKQLYRDLSIRQYTRRDVFSILRGLSSRPCPNRYVNSIFRGINWNLEPSEVNRGFEEWKRNGSQDPNATMADYIRAIRDNVIIKFSSPFESFVRKLDLLYHTMNIALREPEAYENMKNFLLPDQVPAFAQENSLLPSLIFAHVKEITVGDGLFDAALTGKLVSTNTSPSFMLPTRVCVTTHASAPWLSISLQVNPRPSEMRSEASWDNMRGAIDSIIPGWRKSVKDITWHGIARLEEPSETPDYIHTTRICFDRYFSYISSQRNSKPVEPMTFENFNRCLHYIFEQLRPAIIKPSSSTESFDLTKIKVCYNPLFKRVHLKDLLAFAREKVGPRFRVADEEDFKNASWFGLHSKAKYCILCGDK
ncbi:hypothetical protein I302_107416 [Kwoniella bestiolae CBS 10118]|uniref:Uncharacterized protein n=1 Tax=Kwoniella bestiolae CBS 10118 TaxID=1296100 RepID=A0A1B9FYL4_9TREE|nr:hypothetical protein I302_06844 [Kwoniella bestiolae CBS 10118]OCF23859.1 hypothetical protein I302_06844 [Kwoniella bestiolae CBS 10118]